MTDDIESEVQVELKPNTVVVYRGGGHDGCFWEQNVAHIDSEGGFHDLFSSGRKGCHNRDDLQSLLLEPHTVVYDVSLVEDMDRLADQEGLNLLLRMAWAIRMAQLPLAINVRCDCCKERFDIVEEPCHGVNPHCIGGIMSEFRGLVCDQCWDTKYCQSCEVPLREDGTCTYCHEEIEE